MEILVKPRGTPPPIEADDKHWANPRPNEANGSKCPFAAVSRLSLTDSGPGIPTWF